MLVSSPLVTDMYLRWRSDIRSLTWIIYILTIVALHGVIGTNVIQLSPGQQPGDRCVYLTSDCSWQQPTIAPYTHELTLHPQNATTAQYLRTLFTGTIYNVDSGACGEVHTNLKKDGSEPDGVLQVEIVQNCEVLHVTFCNLAVNARIGETAFNSLFKIDLYTTQSPTARGSCSGIVQKDVNVPHADHLSLSMAGTFPRTLVDVNVKYDVSFKIPPSLSLTLAHPWFTDSKAKICVRLTQLNTTFGYPEHDVIYGKPEINVQVVNEWSSGRAYTLCLNMYHGTDPSLLSQIITIRLWNMYFQGSTAIMITTYLCNSAFEACLTTGIGNEAYPLWARSPDVLTVHTADSSQTTTVSHLQLVSAKLVVSLLTTIGNYLLIQFPSQVEFPPFCSVSIQQVASPSSTDPFVPSDDTLYVSRDSRPTEFYNGTDGLRYIKIYLSDVPAHVSNPHPATALIHVNDFVYTDQPSTGISISKRDWVNPTNTFFTVLGPPVVSHSTVIVNSFDPVVYEPRFYYHILSVGLMLDAHFPIPGSIIQVEHSGPGPIQHQATFLKSDQLDLELIYKGTNIWRISVVGLPLTNRLYTQRTINLDFAITVPSPMSEEITYQWKASVLSPSQGTWMNQGTSSMQISTRNPPPFIKTFTVVPVTDLFHHRRATLQVTLITEGFQFKSTDSIQLNIFSPPTNAPAHHLPQQGLLRIDQDPSNQPRIQACSAVDELIHCQVTNDYPSTPPLLATGEQIVIALRFRIELVIPDWIPTDLPRVQLLDWSQTSVADKISSLKLPIYNIEQPPLVVSFAHNLTSRLLNTSVYLPFFHQAGTFGGREILSSDKIADENYSKYTGCLVRPS